MATFRREFTRPLTSTSLRNSITAAGTLIFEDRFAVSCVGTLSPCRANVGHFVGNALFINRAIHFWAFSFGKIDHALAT